MRRRSFPVVLLSAVALVVPDVAASKEIVTTACGIDRCRTVVGGVSGIAVLPTRVQAPSRGRFYTLTIRIAVDRKTVRWRLLYEAKRHVVRAGNEATRSILGNRWRLLAPDVRRAYSLAVKGLEPLPTPPPWSPKPRSAANAESLALSSTTSPPAISGGRDRPRARERREPDGDDT